jgi:hypothetical protein
VTVEMLPQLPSLTAEQAEHWVAAALAEARALRQHDDQLFPGSDEPAGLRSAKALHAAWARWADGAEALYERVRPLLAARRHVAGANDLDYAIGRARAMLQITPEDQSAAIDQVKRGEVVSGEEVRRELRARLQS